MIVATEMIIGDCPSISLNVPSSGLERAWLQIIISSFQAPEIPWFVVEGKGNADARKSFAFLRKEIPVRLANIMNEINLQPSILRQMPSVQQVAGW